MIERESEARPPVGLRERQRRLGREVILDAALTLFNQKGYGKTTMQMIANEAGVGVATVFRHFRTKAGVAAGLMRRDSEELFEHGRAVLAKSHDDAAEAVLDLLLVMLTAWDLPGARLRGFSRIWLATQTGHPETDALVRWADAELLGLLRQQFEMLQDRRLLSTRLEARDMAVVVFCVFNQHYIGLATGDEPTLQQVGDELRRRIPLLFVSWKGEDRVRGPVVKTTAPARGRAASRRRGTG